MGSVISDLYHGELTPNERDYSSDGSIALLLQSFQQNETWLTESLGGEAKEKLLELVNIHDELDGLTSYESFRNGFILGASLVMEVCSGARTVWDDQ